MKLYSGPFPKVRLTSAEDSTQALVPDTSAVSPFKSSGLCFKELPGCGNWLPLQQLTN